LELRGPIGGAFTWRIEDGGPLLLVADGSGLVPLMAMLRHRAAKSSTVDARLLISTGSPAKRVASPRQRSATSPALWCAFLPVGGDPPQ